MRAILSALARAARQTLDDQFVADAWPGIFEVSGPNDALGETLSRWAESDPRPLVLLIDEIDALIGDSLLAVLRQLRAGYPDRPRRFPRSVVLCGVRDVRDYRIRSSAENAVIAGGSAFNIRAESLRLGDFSREEVESLLGQHTEETGQAFTEEARAAVWELTEGQPWLVNALAYEVCFRNKAGRDPKPGGDRRGHPGCPRATDPAAGDASGPAHRQAPGGAGAPGDRAAAQRRR